MGAVVLSIALWAAVPAHSSPCPGVLAGMPHRGGDAGPGVGGDQASPVRPGFVTARRAGSSGSDARDSEKSGTTPLRENQDRGARTRAVQALSGTKNLNELLILVEALNDPDAGVQREAERALRESIDSLGDDIGSSGKEDTRKAAAQALGAAAAALGRVLQTGESRAQSGAGDALRTVAKSTQDSLGTSSAEVRRAAAEVWVDLARAGAQAIESGDSRAQREGSDLLDRMSRELGGLAGKSDAQVRESAFAVATAMATSLGRAGDDAGRRGQRASKQAVEHLAEAVSEHLSSRDPAIRAQAARGLGDIGAARAVEALIETLGDEDPAVRREAAGALARISRQNFGEDTGKWKEWWEQNRDR